MRVGFFSRGDGESKEGDDVTHDQWEGDGWSFIEKMKKRGERERESVKGKKERKIEEKMKGFKIREQEFINLEKC